MTLTSKQKAYIKNAPKFDEHFSGSFKNPEYVQAWLEDTLTTFLNTGDVNEFVDCLVDVVKNSKRGEITRIANEAGINRSNLYDIMNGKVTPRIDTAFKLIRGLGYKYEILLNKIVFINENTVAAVDLHSEGVVTVVSRVTACSDIR